MSRQSAKSSRKSGVGSRSSILAVAVARRLAESRREAKRLRRESEELVSRDATDERELESLDGRRREIDARLEKLECELDKVRPDSERREWLVDMEGRLSEIVHSERRLSASCVALEEARADCGRAEAGAAEAVKRATRTDRVLRKAEAAVETERERREGALTRHAAHRVRVSLEKGEACPVCGETIARLPRREEPPELAEADAALRTEQQQLERARATADEARSKRDEARGTLEGQRAAVDRFAAQLESETDAIVRLAKAIEPTEAGDDAFLGDSARQRANGAAPARGRSL